MQSLFSIPFAVSAACAAIMGFAIQRGATCTVAAVDEWVSARRATRLASMLEASLFVVAGLLLAHTAGLSATLPAGFALDASTVTGAALLGFGAYVNRACVFGALARLGNGEWAYAAMPFGFYLGCVSVDALFPRSPLAVASSAPWLLVGPMWLAAAVVAFAVLRMAHGFYLSPLWRARGTTRQGIAQKARKSWSPHVATCVIGMTFVVILLASGNWAYTDVLAELAHGRAANIVARCGLFVALVAGAVFGGATAGRFRSVPITPSQLARCLAGGVLMGWGSLLIPGSNDGLILTGLPLLRPYAWAAFVTMCVVIGCALTIERRLSAARVPRASAPASPAE